MTFYLNQWFQFGARLIGGEALNNRFAQPAPSVDGPITALGVGVADAYSMRAALSFFGTVAAGTGAKLLANAAPGTVQFAFNDGANPLTIYDSSGATIDGVAGATGVPLANGKRAIFIKKTPTSWESAQLGVVSA